MTANPGRPDSALVLLHGITGRPEVYDPVVAGLRETVDATIVVPLLPGHGTHHRDLARTGYAQWYDHALAVLEHVRSAHAHVVVCGLSMGGTVALDLAARTDLVDRLVVINPALRIDSPWAWALPVLRCFGGSVAAIKGDIAAPGVEEPGYDRTPVRAVASLQAGQKALRRRLPDVHCPVVLVTSGVDHVVGPWSADHLRGALPERPREVVLRRSHHVATLDHDVDRIVEVLAEAVWAGP